MSADPPTILLVEDNPGDVRLMREALAEIGKPVDLHVASDGAEALSFLKRDGVHRNAARPALVFLDLNLTTMHGHDLLACIKGEKSLATIPVVVLSSSEAEADISKSYELHASCHCRKPAEFAEFQDLIKTLCEFWLTKVQLPRGAESAPV